MTNTFEEQLKTVINEYESACSKSVFGDGSDVVSIVQITDIQTRCIASIERITGQKSIYSRKIAEISKQQINVYGHTAKQIGVAKALLSDIQNGHIKSLEEIVHGDLFSDFLEMAEYLSGKKYKDAAAVIAGSTLEVHIKKLCKKFDVSITSGSKKKKTEILNTELVKANAYSKSDQKMVTSCLDIRNSAAHGDYSEYDNAQVKLLIGQIRHFITRHPA